VAKKTGRKAGPKVGRTRTEKAARAVVVSRPFEGLAAECDLVALREFVPSATAQLTLAEPGRPVLLGTVLPMASAALVRAGDENGGDELGLIGLQVQNRSDDVSRDLGAAISWRVKPALASRWTSPTAVTAPAPRICWTRVRS